MTVTDEPRRRPTMARAVIAVLVIMVLIMGTVAAAFGGVLVQREQVTVPPDSYPINLDARPLQPIPDAAPPGVVDRPETITDAGWAAQELNWSSCEGGECAEVLAPLDWADPGGPTAVTLHLRKIAATASPRIGTIFVNPGGPGGSGADYAAAFDRTGLEQYDIIGWDPRGVGNSTPVQCSNEAMEILFAQDSSPDDADERRLLMQAEVNFGASCLEESGVLLEHISTHDTVQDLEMLRSLVGDRRLNYYGASYGTDIGARYATTFPLTSGRLVLDGAVSVSDDNEVTQSAGFQRALEGFAEWCAGQETCELGGTADEVLGLVTQVTETLDHSPLQVSNRELNQTAFVTGVVQMLYADESAWPYLAQGIQDVREGRGALMLTLADSYWQRDESGQYGDLLKAFSAIRCLDEPDDGYAAADAEAAEAAGISPWAGRFLGPDYACPSWPVAAVEEQEPIGVADGAQPILVVGTTGDSATPYENSVDMAEQLGVGRLLTFDGAGHVAYGRNDCVNQTIRDYFRDAIPEGETTCRP